MASIEWFLAIAAAIDREWTLLCVSRKPQLKAVPIAVPVLVFSAPFLIERFRQLEMLRDRNWSNWALASLASSFRRLITVLKLSLVGRSRDYDGGTTIMSCISGLAMC